MDTNERLGHILRRGKKTERITLRISPKVKADIRAAAKAYGLSMSTYLLGLHRCVQTAHDGKQD